MSDPGHKYGDTIPDSPFHIDAFRKLLDENGPIATDVYANMYDIVRNVGEERAAAQGILRTLAAIRAKLGEAESATLLRCTLCGGAGVVPGSGSTSAAEPLPCSKCEGSGVVGFVSADYARNLSRQNADLREAIEAMADGGSFYVAMKPNGKWAWRDAAYPTWSGDFDSAADAALAGLAAMKGPST